MTADSGDEPTEIEGPAIERAAGEAATQEQGRRTGRPRGLEPAEETTWRSWVLVGVVVVCFLIVPGIILFIPAASGYLAAMGLSQRQAYLAFPMIPAIILGLTAVWAAVRTQRPR